MTLRCLETDRGDQRGSGMGKSIWVTRVALVASAVANAPGCSSSWIGRRTDSMGSGLLPRFTSSRTRKARFEAGASTLAPMRQRASWEQVRR